MSDTYNGGKLRISSFIRFTLRLNGIKKISFQTNQNDEKTRCFTLLAFSLSFSSFFVSLLVFFTAVGFLVCFKSI